MREAVRLAPNLSEAWGRLGLYLINLSRYKEAREPLQRAIAIEPSESHYYWALGDTYLLDSPDPRNFKTAEQFYRQALNIDPRNAKALYSYGMALTRRGSPDDLRQAAKEVDKEYKIIDSGPMYDRLQRVGKDVVAVLEAVAHLVDDCLRLPRVLTRAEDEEVGVRAHRPHVEDDDVLGQLLLGEAGDSACLVE